MKRFFLVILFTLVPLGAARAVVEEFSMESEYQTGEQSVAVLLPDHYDKEQKYRVLYVLPTDAGQKFKNVLNIFRRLDTANSYNVIVVAMSFGKEPWFGDHATDTRVRQASYLKEFLIPYVEGKYSTLGSSEGRLLLGFSKSGWGAFSLIFHDPDFYGFAASWDAPLMFDKLHYGMGDVYGTRERLQEWRPDLLAQKNAGSFQKSTRLVLAGEDLWGNLVPSPAGESHTTGFHNLLESYGIKHVYKPDLKTKHTWSEVWMKPVLEELMKLAGK
jgi:enterochelin esterase-like enzyme